MNEILILGAGYAGLAATIGLVGRLKGRDDVHVTLINPQTRFTERLRLHQVASGQELVDLQIPDQLAGTGRGLHPRLGHRNRCGCAHRSGRRHVCGQLRHPDLRVGQRRRHRDVPGVDEFAYTLDSAADATLLAEQLDRLSAGPMVVAGGGLTGVESAAEVAEQHSGTGQQLVMCSLLD